MKMERLAEKQRAFFESGRTRDVNFRMAALRRLRDGIGRWEGRIKAALYQDLHKSSFESYMTEISLVREEIDFLLKHMKEYAGTERVPAVLSQFPGRCFVK